MKQLTQKDRCGNWCVKGLHWENLHAGAVITPEVSEKLYGCLWKLMEYEDTGLDPEDIEKMKEAASCETAGQQKGREQ